MPVYHQSELQQQIAAVKRAIKHAQWLAVPDVETLQSVVVLLELLHDCAGHLPPDKADATN